LKRAADKTKEKYIESMCNKIMEFQRTDIRSENKEMRWEENTGF
jgi:hypothetical protein